MRPFGEWAPDAAALSNDLLTVARNVYPRVNSYGPVFGLLAQSTTALPSTCRGIWFVQKTDGSYDTYAATRAKIYKYNADTLAFDDVSRLVGGAYDAPSDDFWSGAQFGNRLILTQLGDDVQYIDVDLGMNFAALPGSPPRARFVSVMDDKVILGNLTSNPRAISWSDVNDSEEWTLGLADTQEFPDHGAVMGVFPHARLVLLERGMRSIISTGDTLSFEFPELTSQKGTNSPWGCIEFGDTLYWLSEDGFYAGNANGHSNFSDNKVTQYFFDTMNRERLFQVFGTFDPYGPRIYFTYPTGDTEYNDRVLVYDRSLDRFSELLINTYVLARLATSATTMEGGSDDTDMDAPGLPSLDSRIYMAGAPILVAVGTDLKLSTLAGDTLEATLQPGPYELEEDYRSRVQWATLRAEGLESGNATLKVSKRTTLDQEITFGSAVSRQASGRYPLNHDGAFHDFHWTMPAESTWTHMIGWNERHVRASER